MSQSPNEYTNIALEVSGRNLPNQLWDTIDPYVKLFETSVNSTKPEILGMTEVQDNNQNPDFTTLLEYRWKKGTGQMLTFKLTDSDPIRDTWMGEAQVDADAFATDGFAANLTLSKGGSLLLQRVETIKIKIKAEYSTPAADEVPALEIGWKRGENGIEKPLDKMAASGLGKGKHVWNGIVEFTRFSLRTDQKLLLHIREGKENYGELTLDLDPFVQKGLTQISTLKNAHGTFYFIFTPQ